VILKTIALLVVVDICIKRVMEIVWSATCTIHYLELVVAIAVHQHLRARILLPLIWLLPHHSTASS
jgi:hypothetical protein